MGEENEIFENISETVIVPEIADVAEEVAVSEPVVEETVVEKPAKASRSRKKKVEVSENTGELSTGEVWWKKIGEELNRRGYSQRNIVLRAARSAGRSFDDAMKVLAKKAPIAEKAKSLFG